MFKRLPLLVFTLTVFCLPSAAQLQRTASTADGNHAAIVAVTSVEVAAAPAMRISQNPLSLTLPPSSLRSQLMTLGLPMGGQYVCPSGTPLNCHNGYCCPSGHTLQCPHSTCDGVPDGMNGCYNPDKLTPDLLAALRNCCPGLVSCN